MSEQRRGLLWARLSAFRAAQARREALVDAERARRVSSTALIEAGLRAHQAALQHRRGERVARKDLRASEARYGWPDGRPTEGAARDPTGEPTP